MQKFILLTALTLFSSSSFSAETSAANRAEKKFQLSYGIAGREYVGTASSINASYYLQPDDLLTLSYSVFNGSDKDAARKMRAVTLGYRKFYGNSFNIMPSLYWRRNTSDYYKEGVLTYIVGTNNLIYEDVGAGIRLGNEWQWENFSFGCDWLGINHTLIKLNKKEEGLGIIDVISLEKALTVTVLKFYLGYSF